MIVGICASNCSCLAIPKSTTTQETVKSISLIFLGMRYVAILGMLSGVKTTCFEAPGELVGGSGVSMRWGMILRIQ